MFTKIEDKYYLEPLEVPFRKLINITDKVASYIADGHISGTSDYMALVITKVFRRRVGRGSG